MRCPKCNHENGTEAKFCARCGASIACRECGAPLADTQKFCSTCGAFIEGIGRRTSVLPNYTPAYLAQKIFETREVLEGERKLVTVLFCDIVGSASLAEKLGAEAMHALISRFFDTAMDAVHATEGTINQFLGDGFMALFGAPIAHEDHARRAALAALALQRACHAALADPASGRVTLRIGLNTGSVVVGKIGDNLRMDYTAIGDTVNMAARMQQHAAPGEIALTQASYEMLRQHFDCDAVGERRIKGKTELMPVYRLRAARSAQAVSADPSAALVGRSSELAKLEECLSRLRSGEGGVALLVGEAGLGKSRLLSEIQRTRAPALRWLRGHALSFGNKSSYAPFSEALRSAVPIDERATPDSAWRLLESFLSERLGEPGRSLLPFAGMLLGIELPAIAKGLVARLDPLDVRGQIFIVARRIFESLARAQHTVLVLEDWQWADEASAALLAHLLPLVESEALLILTAARPDRSGPVRALGDFGRERVAPRYVAIVLEPLGDGESMRLIDELLARTPVSSALREQIMRKGEGNPLFIEEVVQALRSAATSRASLNPAVIELPNSIEALISARIDRLDADAKHVLRLAAVIGRNFYWRVLQVLDAARAELDQDLDRLQQVDLIHRRRIEPDLEYMFKHALVHEASYRSILEQRRRRLHEQVAEAIETLFADRLNEIAGSLAFHYAQAGNQAKAQRYLLRAGDQAARMAADVEALAHYQEAMQSYERAFGDKWDRSEHASLERKIGEALYRLGRHAEATEHLYKALDLLGYRYPRSRLRLRLSIVAELLRQLWHQIRRARYSSYDVRPSSADDDRIRAFISLGWMDFFIDEERFFFDVLTALNWAERERLGEAVAQGRMGLGLACNVLRRHRLASYYHGRAYAIAEALDDPGALATAHFGLGYHYELTGEWNRAMEHLDKACALYGSQHKMCEQALCVATSSSWLQWAGEFGRARRLTQELSVIARDSGDAVTRLYATEREATLLMYDGQLAAAADELRLAIEGLLAREDRQIACWSVGQLAQCLLWMGELTRTENVVTEGRRLMQQNRIAPENTVNVRTNDGWLALARLEQATRWEKRSAMRRARRAIAILRRLEGGFMAAAPIALCLEACVDWLDGAHTKAEHRWQASIEKSARIGFNYQAAVTYLEMGRLKHEVSHLLEALRMFERFGCTIQVARTLRHLGEISRDRAPAAARAYLERSLALHRQMSADHERAATELALAEL